MTAKTTAEPGCRFILHLKTRWPKAHHLERASRSGRWYFSRQEAEKPVAAARTGAAAFWDFKICYRKNQLLSSYGTTPKVTFARPHSRTGPAQMPVNARTYPN